MLAVLDMKIAEVQSFLKKDPECVPLQRKLEELIHIQQHRDHDKLVLQKLAQTDKLSMLSSTHDNNDLGKFNLDGIPPMMPLGQPPQINVCFDVDVNGILNVSTLEKSTEKENKITITNDKGQLSQDDNECIVQEAEKYKQAKDDANNNRIEAKNGLENYCYGLKSSIEGEVLKDKIPADDKGTLLAAVEETTSWLDANQTAEKDEFEEKQKALEAIAMPILHFNLDGIPPMMPLGQLPQINVCFNIDVDGILNVLTLEKTTEKENKITITNDKGQLSQDHNECMVQKAEKYKQAKDDANNNRIEAKNGLENYCYGLKSSIEGEVLKDKIPADDIGTLLAAIEETTSWLDANQTAEKEEFEEKQKALEAIAMPILHFNLDGIPPMMPLGQPPQINVCFDIDVDGILNVSTLEKSTKKENKITITNDKGQLSQDDNECMVLEAEKYKQAKDDANNYRIEAKNGLENYFYGLKSSIEGEVLKDKIPADDKGTLLAAVEETTSWLDGNQTAAKEEFEEKQKALEAIAMPILQKMVGAGGMPGGMGGIPDVGEDIIFYSFMKTSVGNNGASPMGCSDIMEQDNVQQETNVSINLRTNLLVHS
jgi:molecular chaperone DnaK (HSP70)